MFNVAVVNIKDIVKYLVSVIVVIAVITGITKYFNKIKNNSKIQVTSQVVQDENLVIGLDKTIPGIEEINEEELIEKNEDDDESMLAKILKVELGIFELDKEKSVEVSNNIDTNIITNEVAEEENNISENSNVENVSTNIPTKVVTPNPIVEKYTYQYSKVKIKNETNFELRDDMFSNGFSLQNKNILIFHTHTCESYTSSPAYTYVPTGNYRTTDKKYSVVRLGDELTNYLTSYGYNVVHDSTYHDYPSYSGSYTRSRQTVNNLLKKQDAEIIIDLHRDAIGSKSDYAPTVKIGEENAAQLMFVIGTNGGGLYHPNWIKNLQFAVAVQQKAEEMYPGLFKTIILRNSRYNQHLGEAACIIEVGATGNTLDQCLVSQKYLAKVLDEVIK